MRARDELQEVEEDRMGTEEDDEEEERVRNLRSKATELLLREEFEASMKVYSQIISLCQESISQKSPDAKHCRKLQKALCLAYSNRAEARAKSSRFSEALDDCDEALKIEHSHFKTLLCKGKILLNLNRYTSAMDCFISAKNDSQPGESIELVNGLLEKCKKLEFLSKTGALDVSDWVLSGFNGKKIPELGEYIGPLEIKISEISNRGLFATKNIDSGTLLLITKAVAVDRVIMPKDSGENAQLVLWKNFVDRIRESIEKCSRLSALVSTLSTGEDEEEGLILQVPDMDLFKPETDIKRHDSVVDKSKLLSILDANSMLEDAVSSKVLGKNSDYQSVGLWILPSFINHSCNPNVRRIHIGDHMIVHASRDVKAGEELSFAYFNVLSPLSQRREMALNWGFKCNCMRCRFEESIWNKSEVREIETVMGKVGLFEMGNVVYKVEEMMKNMMVRGKSKGSLRASFWEAYEQVLTSEKMMRKWGRKIPAGESVVEVAGSDERIMRVFTGRERGIEETEKRMKLGRGIYGKIMKKSALRTLV